MLIPLTVEVKNYCKHNNTMIVTKLYGKHQEVLEACNLSQLFGQIGISIW